MLHYKGGHRYGGQTKAALCVKRRNAQGSSKLLAWTYLIESTGEARAFIQAFLHKPVQTGSLASLHSCCRATGLQGVAQQIPTV